MAALGWLAFQTGHLGVEQWVEHRSHRRTNALEWIERTFHPVPETLAAMRSVHEAYAPRREALADELNRERRTLAGLVLNQDRWSPDVAAQIERMDEVVARSQMLTWQYLYEISSHLSPTDARAFRREMAAATLAAGAGPTPQELASGEPPRANGSNLIVGREPDATSTTTDFTPATSAP